MSERRLVSRVKLALEEHVGRPIGHRGGGLARADRLVDGQGFVELVDPGGPFGVLDFAPARLPCAENGGPVLADAAKIGVGTHRAGPPLVAPDPGCRG